MAHLSFPADFPPSKLSPLVEEVANLLKGRNETVSVAETVCYILFLYVSILAFVKPCVGCEYAAVGDMLVSWMTA